MLRATHHIRASIRTLSILSLQIAFIFITESVQSVYANQDECKQLNVSGIDEKKHNVSLTSPTNKPKIFGQQLVTKIARHLGIPAKVIPNLPWARAIQMTKDGYLDMGTSSPCQHPSQHWI
jgi:hypothetical protein